MTTVIVKEKSRLVDYVQELAFTEQLGAQLQSRYETSPEQFKLLERGVYIDKNEDPNSERKSLGKFTGELSKS
ncbi:hypothetical protein Misp06_04414 [Microbulbifer sp. NBRC 101763]